MKQVAFIIAVAASSILVQTALADSAKPAASSAAAQPAYSTDETTIGDLLDNKDTYAILKKYLPEIVDSDQVDLTRNMTLRQIQQYAPDEVTDAKLVEVDSEFAKLKAQQQ